MASVRPKAARARLTAVAVAGWQTSETAPNLMEFEGVSCPLCCDCVQRAVDACCSTDFEDQADYGEETPLTQSGTAAHDFCAYACACFAIAVHVLSVFAMARAGLDSGSVSVRT